MPTSIRPASSFVWLLLGALVLPSAAVAQERRSAAAAKELAGAMERLKLDAIAAPDPSTKDGFVAALIFPGSQLLVVSARYSVPSLLVDKLAKKEFRDIYIDLNAASVAGTKVFVMDQGADGLVPKPDNTAGDSIEREGRTVTFDGEWRAAKMSEEEYQKAFAAADDLYARLLTALTEHARKAGS